MKDLFTRALDAHGGLSRGREIDAFQLKVSIGGGRLTVLPDGLRAAPRRVQAHRPRVTITPFGGAARTGHCTPDRVWIEEAKGGVVEERAAPRASFAGHVLTTPWDTLQARSFVSYALWNYLDIPFVCTAPGFETREIGPHEENGETWHRLLVKYPPSIPTHCAEQVLYCNAQGLLQRLDYAADVVGDKVAGAAAHYCFDHTPFGGLVIPTLRRAVSRTPKGAVCSGPTVVLCQLSDITLTPDAPKERSNDRERTTVCGEEVLSNQGPEHGLYRRGRRRSHRVRAWKPDLILSVAQRHASLSWPGPADCLRHDRDGRVRETARLWPRPLHLRRAAQLSVRAVETAGDREGCGVCAARLGFPLRLRLDAPAPRARLGYRLHGGARSAHDLGGLA